MYIHLLLLIGFIFNTGTALKSWNKCTITFKIVDYGNFTMSRHLINQSIIEAFGVWQSDLLKFEIARYHPDIFIYFSDFKNIAMNYAYAYANRELIKFNTNIKWDTDTLYKIAIHEVGHVLGLEHVENKNDVMYSPYNNMSELSDNNIKELYKLYNWCLPVNHCDIKYDSIAVMHDYTRNIYKVYKQKGFKYWYLVNGNIIEENIDILKTWKVYTYLPKINAIVGYLDYILIHSGNQYYVFDKHGRFITKRNILYDIKCSDVPEEYIEDLNTCFNNTNSNYKVYSSYSKLYYICDELVISIRTDYSCKFYTDANLMRFSDIFPNIKSKYINFVFTVDKLTYVSYYNNKYYVYDEYNNLISMDSDINDRLLGCP